MLADRVQGETTLTQEPESDLCVNEPSWRPLDFAMTAGNTSERTRVDAGQSIDGEVGKRRWDLRCPRPSEIDIEGSDRVQHNDHGMVNPERRDHKS